MKIIRYPSILLLSAALCIALTVISSTAAAVDPGLAYLLVSPADEDNEQYRRQLTVELALTLDGIQVQSALSGEEGTGPGKLDELWQLGLQNRAQFVIYVQAGEEIVRSISMVVLFDDRAVARTVEEEYPKENPETLTLLIRQLTDEVYVFLDSYEQAKDTAATPEGWFELQLEESSPPAPDTLEVTLGLAGTTHFALFDKTGIFGWYGGEAEITLSFHRSWHLAFTVGGAHALLQGAAVDSLTGNRLTTNLFGGKRWNRGKWRLSADLGFAVLHSWFSSEPESGSSTDPRWFDLQLALRAGAHYQLARRLLLFAHLLPILNVDRDQITLPGETEDIVLYQSPWMELGVHLGLAWVLD